MPGAMTTSARPVEAMQQHGDEDLPGVFGVGGPEDGEDRPEKKRRFDGPLSAEEA